jgi:hypothetical protein
MGEMNGGEWCMAFIAVFPPNYFFCRFLPAKLLTSRFLLPISSRQNRGVHFLLPISSRQIDEIADFFPPNG